MCRGGSRQNCRWRSTSPARLPNNRLALFGTDSNNVGRYGAETRRRRFTVLHAGYPAERPAERRRSATAATGVRDPAAGDVPAALRYICPQGLDVVIDAVPAARLTATGRPSG
ncbi:hypothetical protein GCM10022225_08080 [Plantactinospora mayteni]|uniref:Uncharacterized protein n=1 Tax=Plantactinospora mayteni TaxID=566021 RepID=A0ABQ4EI89_9ACTN|nr:hypothetical protein Pma05_10190 [Plantactinospora mayteni]